MKRLIFMFAVFAALTTACNNDDSTSEQPTNEQHQLDATSYTKWHYIDLETNKIIASLDDEDGQVPASMKSNKEWDIAICRYQVRTNSGASTTSGKGGLYTYAKDIKIDGVTSLPTDLKWVVDIDKEQPQMNGGTLTYSISTAVVSVMEGGMPPTWVKSPLYIVKSGDGNSTYIVDMLGYKDDKGTSGHVRFQYKSLK